MSKGILFVGHGTRFDQGDAEFTQFVAQVITTLVQTRPHAMSDVLCEYAYVELRDPDVTSSIVDMAQRGVQDLVVAPLLLFSAGHFQVDIPRAVAKAQRCCPQLRVTITPPLGHHQTFVDVAATRLIDAGFEARPGNRVVLVGRGSQDETAREDFLDAAMRLQQRLGAASWVHCGFLAGLGPTLDTAVQLARKGVLDDLETRPTVASTHQVQPRVFLLPYLWFLGRLTQGLAKQAFTWQQQDGQVEYLVAPHLGLHPDLVTNTARHVYLEGIARAFVGNLSGREHIS